MAFEIIWTTDAVDRIENILDYLQNKWGSSSVDNFLDQFESHLRMLAIFPESGSIEYPEKSIRGTVVHSKTKIFYRLEQDKIILLRIFDTRQQTPDL